MRLVPIRRATQKERRIHAAYLRGTPVGWLHILLEHGAPYWIASLDELGSTKTIGASHLCEVHYIDINYPRGA